MGSHVQRAAISEPSEADRWRLSELERTWHVALQGDWTDWILGALLQGVTDLGWAMRGPGAFEQRVGQVRFLLNPLLKVAGLTGLWGPIRLLPEPNALTPWTVVHELGHRWDFRSMGRKLPGGLSRTFSKAVGAYDPLPFPLSAAVDAFVWTRPDRIRYLPGDSPTARPVTRWFNAFEDFADSVAAFVYPNPSSVSLGSDWGYTNFRATRRGRVIGDMLAGL
jgi:hypothetical protein